LNESMKPLVLNQLSRPTSQTGTIHGGMLTKREKEVLILIKKEHTVPQISKVLNIAESTVISHRKALLSKLQAKNTAGLINAIYKYNLLD
jgi:DNA-binding NarL/FixJ family response regulator